MSNDVKFKDSTTELRRWFGNLKQNPVVCVLDIETRSTETNAIIPSIGAVVGNVLTGEVLGRFYETIEHIDGQEGRVRDDSTESFWERMREECPEAWAEIYDPKVERKPLKEVLEKFSEFMRGFFGDDRGALFGNGPEFDNNILEHAYKSFGLKPCWKYVNNQSIRTALWYGIMIFGVDLKKQLYFKGIKHHALDDAEYEFTILFNVTSRMMALRKIVDYVVERT